MGLARKLVRMKSKGELRSEMTGLVLVIRSRCLLEGCIFGFEEMPNAKKAKNCLFCGKPNEKDEWRSEGQKEEYFKSLKSND